MSVIVWWCLRAYGFFIAQLIIKRSSSCWQFRYRHVLNSFDVDYYWIVIYSAGPTITIGEYWVAYYIYSSLFRQMKVVCCNVVANYTGRNATFTLSRPQYKLFGERLPGLDQLIELDFTKRFNGKMDLRRAECRSGAPRPPKGGAFLSPSRLSYRLPVITVNRNDFIDILTFINKLR